MNKYKALYESQRAEYGKVLDMVNQIKSTINPAGNINFNRSSYENMLIAKDRVLCANRYEWQVPNANITSQQIEAMFYDYGALCIFENEFAQIVFAKFIMTGQLNDIGTLCEIQPIDFAGKTYPKMKAVIAGRDTAPIAVGEKVAVIIYDYTTLTQAPDEMCRREVNRNTTIRSQCDVYSQLYNNILLSNKKAIGVCDSEEQAGIIERQIASMLGSSTPIQVVCKQRGKGAKVIEELPFELFNFDNNFDTQNYCQTIDFYDKQRRSFNGIPAPDTFEKKERKITAESENTNVHTNIMLYDGLMQRQYGVELFKKYCQNAGNKGLAVDVSDVLKAHEEDTEETEDMKNNGEDDNNERSSSQ